MARENRNDEICVWLTVQTNQEPALRGGSHPLAGRAAQLRAGRRNVERGHDHRHEVQQEAEESGHRADGGAREIRDPRGLDVLQKSHRRDC